MQRHFRTFANSAAHLFSPPAFGRRDRGDSPAFAECAQLLPYGGCWVVAAWGKDSLGSPVVFACSPVCLGSGACAAAGSFHRVLFPAGCRWGCDPRPRQLGRGLRARTGSRLYSADGVCLGCPAALPHATGDRRRGGRGFDGRPDQAAGRAVPPSRAGGRTGLGQLLRLVPDVPAGSPARAIRRAMPIAAFGARGGSDGVGHRARLAVSPRPLVVCDVCSPGGVATHRIVCPLPERYACRSRGGLPGLRRLPQQPRDRTMV